MNLFLKMLIPFVAALVALLGIIPFLLFTRAGKYICWALRHPVYAWCQFRHKLPYSTVRERGLPLLFLFAVILFFTGCATGPNSALLQSVSQQAAFETGMLLKDKYPNELDLTYTSLNAFVAVGGGTANDLARALSPLPIKALQGTNGVVLAQGSALLIHSGGQVLLNLNTNVANVNNQYVLPVATGLRNGLGQALGK